MKSHKRSASLLALLSGTALLFWLILRCTLLVSTGLDQVSAVAVAKAFALGLWFDAATLAFLIVPFLLLRALMPDAWRHTRWAGGVAWGTLWLMTALLLFGVVSEYIFWQEFSTRFNFIAVDYLIYTTEVVGNIMQSYPVGWLLFLIGALAGAWVYLLSRRFQILHAALSTRSRLASLVVALALPLASGFLADVEQMNVTGNAYADELAGNGLHTLAAAMRRNELDYDRFYRTLPQEKADAILLSQGVEREPLSHEVLHKDDVHEEEEMGPFLRKPRNIVLITVESLSAKYLGSYGSTRQLTPNLDRLAAAGLRFEQVYATGTRTVRGLDALSLGTPPIPGQAIIRRQNNEHLATVGEFLEQQGYATFFFYGGYGYFDNMNAYFKANDYRIVDRTDFPEKSVIFENVWGVADEVLFDHVLPELDATSRQGRPFFAHVMTTSNHRPYTYPDGRIDIPSPGGRAGAVKYTDYAIGRFIEQARSKPWFKDTLFVIVADHCASVAGKTRLPVDRYRIPLIFYAPEMLKPGTYSRMVSQIDIAPTLLDLVGKNGDDHFFGQSIFEAEALGWPERAFISNYQQLGYYKNGLLTVLSPRRKVEAFRIGVEDVATLAEVDPALADEAVAYYQTAARAFKRGALRETALRQN